MSDDSKLLPQVPLPSNSQSGSLTEEPSSTTGTLETSPEDRATGIARVGIAALMVLAFIALMILIPILIFKMLGLLELPKENPSTFDKVALVGSLQVGLGMYLGFVVTFLGTAMSWLGVREAFSLAARARVNQEGIEGKLAYQSAGPGLLFAALGVALIWASLYKELKISEPSPWYDQNDKSIGTKEPPPTTKSRKVSDENATIIPGQ